MQEPYLLLEVINTLFASRISAYQVLIECVLWTTKQISAQNDLFMLIGSRCKISYTTR
jgi:hypothetical protein